MAHCVLKGGCPFLQWGVPTRINCGWKSIVGGWWHLYWIEIQTTNSSFRYTTMKMAIYECIRYWDLAWFNVRTWSYYVRFAYRFHDECTLDQYDSTALLIALFSFRAIPEFFFICSFPARYNWIFWIDSSIECLLIHGILLRLCCKKYYSKKTSTLITCCK